MLAFAAAIFSSAFLLFQVQPILGKYILPWFGGSPNVWTACLLCFQVLLLAGYAYSHLLSTRLSPRLQVAIHMALVLVAAVSLPVIPRDSWKPTGSEDPVGRIILVLLVSAGLPYFALSATSPLIQQWFRQARGSNSPYRLYALSNVGSLLALVSYPFLVEPRLTRQAQATFWTAGFFIFMAAIGVSAFKFLRSGSPATAGETEDKAAVPHPAVVQRTLWWLLPAWGSLLLVATTSKMCQDIAVVPFLWVLPLALYLLSFIIAFDSPRWYNRFYFTLLLIAALAGLTWALYQGTNTDIKLLIGVYAGGMFVCCTVCHGELFRLRPHPAHLTWFYLSMAAGSAGGAAFASLIAPRFLHDYYEFHIALFGCGLLFVIAAMREWNTPTADFQTAGEATSTDPDKWRWLACVLPLAAFGGLDFVIANAGKNLTGAARLYLMGLRIFLWVLLITFSGYWAFRQRHWPRKYWKIISILWLGLGVAALGTVLWSQASRRDPYIVEQTRNFYGVLTVYEHYKDEPLSHHLLLQHGGTTHGIQFLDPDQFNWPTTYYGAESGVGKALQAIPAAARRVGLVGLGTGTLLTYGQAGDYFRVYEINPEIVRLAKERFTFVEKCRADTEIVLGDARMSMERDLPQEFDLLVLDAFSADAIPAHLLTREAFALYDRHLRSSGIIAVHISNHYLDLEPVVSGLAREFNLGLTVVDYEDDEEPDRWWLYSSTWILLSRDRELLRSEPIEPHGHNLTSKIHDILWTDDFVSLYQILK